MTLQEQLKRDSLIKQLKKFGIHEIDGQALSKVKYSTLLRTLAVKRVAND